MALGAARSPRRASGGCGTLRVTCCINGRGWRGQMNTGTSEEAGAAILVKTLAQNPGGRKNK